MAEQKTSTGMPIVEGATIDALLGRYTGRTSSDWTEYLNVVRGRMVTENPELVRYSNRILGYFPPKIRDEVAQVIIEIYAALESQTSDDLLRRQLGE